MRTRASTIECEAEDEPATNRPAHQQPHAGAERRAAQDAKQRAGHRHGLHRQQILEREMETDAEHQEDDADFAELGGEFGVGDEAGRERADDDACHEIAHQRRRPQPGGESA
jgi:hypothetical protein